MISSHSNALIKRIRKLQQKKYREQEGAFFVEGIRIVLTALEQKAPVQVLVYAPELLTSATALAAIEAQKQAGNDVVAVTAELFQSFSRRENAVGLGAVVRARLAALEQLEIGEQSFVVALERVSDPGNLGAIVRTVDAAGGAGVILLGPSTDPFHPTAIRASMGAIFNTPVAALDQAQTLLAWARQRGLQIVATSAHAGRSFWGAPYRTPLLALFGSEGDGLLPELQAAADLAVAIPMHGVASSLNLAVSVGLMLYELRATRPVTSRSP